VNDVSVNCSSKLQIFERVRKSLCVVTPLANEAAQHNLRGSRQSQHYLNGYWAKLLKKLFGVRGSPKRAKQSFGGSRFIFRKRTILFQLTTPFQSREQIR